MPTKDEVIEQFYWRFEEGAQRFHSRIKASAEHNTMGIRVKDVDEFIKRNHFTVVMKFFCKKFKSFVALGPKHTLQVDLFNFTFEQAVNFQSNPPPPC